MSSTSAAQETSQLWANSITIPSPQYNVAMVIFQAKLG